MNHIPTKKNASQATILNIRTILYANAAFKSHINIYIMVPVSIVIIAKSKADILAGCIAKAQLITDDIVVIDSDDTTDFSEIAGCRVLKKKWEGYGTNKNKGVDAAKYNWILSIDADEIVDDELIEALHDLQYNDPSIVYDIKFCSYFGKKQVRFGSWGRDHHIRLFNRNKVRWSETMVHETLVLPDNVTIRRPKGHVHHYSVNNADEFESKGIYYARLSAKKYFKMGKRTSTVKLYLSPLFGFIKNYIFFFGFLDGRAGWDIAKITVKNTRRKYLFLNGMEAQQQKKQTYKDRFAVEY